MGRKLTRLVLAVLLFVPFAAIAQESASERSDEETPPVIETRKIVITDSVCGVSGVGRTDHRRCVLKKFGEGERLLFYDVTGQRLYEVEFASDKLKVVVVNDFAGYSAYARGIWDDEKGVVSLLKILEAKDAKEIETLPGDRN